MSTDTHPVWTPSTPDERRHVAVADLVAHVMSRPEGHRYAAAYGVLAGLVSSSVTEMGTTWAREFAAGVNVAMTERPFDHRASST